MVVCHVAPRCTSGHEAAVAAVILYCGNQLVCYWCATPQLAAGIAAVARRCLKVGRYDWPWWFRTHHLDTVVLLQCAGVVYKAGAADGCYVVSLAALKCNSGVW